MPPAIFITMKHTFDNETQTRLIKQRPVILLFWIASFGTKVEKFFLSFSVLNPWLVEMQLFWEKDRQKRYW